MKANTPGSGDEALEPGDGYAIHYSHLQATCSRLLLAAFDSC